MICLKDHGSTSDWGWAIEILKMWNAKKNIKGGTLEKKNSVEQRKWKVLEIARFGEKKISFDKKVIILLLMCDVVGSGEHKVKSKY